MSYAADASAITPQEAMLFRRVNTRQLALEISADLRVAHREAATEIGDMIGRVVRGEKLAVITEEVPPQPTGRRWNFWPVRRL